MHLPGLLTVWLNKLLDGLDRKTKIATAELRHRAPARLKSYQSATFEAGRSLAPIGVAYTSEIDSIRIEHQAYNRRGFALGAVVAAEWIVGKRGMHEFSDLF